MFMQLLLLVVFDISLRPRAFVYVRRDIYSSCPCFDNASRIMVSSFLLIFPSRLKSHPFKIVSSKSLRSVVS